MNSGTIIELQVEYIKWWCKYNTWNADAIIEMQIKYIILGGNTEM